MNGSERYLPFVVAAVAVFYVGFASVPPEDRDGQMKLHEFGKVLVVDGGRLKPFESAARNDLMVLSGRQVYRDPGSEVKYLDGAGVERTYRVADGGEHSAVEWMLDALTSRVFDDAREDGPIRPKAADEHMVFRIENDQILKLLDLPAKPGSYRYSLEEIAAKGKEFDDAVARASNRKDPDLTDQKILELAKHIQIHQELVKLKTPLMVDPDNPNAEPVPIGELMRKAYLTMKAQEDAGEKVAPPPLLSLLKAYHDNDAPRFNAALAVYQKQLATAMPAETTRAAVEVWFNDFDPFFHCTLLYVGVFILTCLSWVVFPNPLKWSAFALGAVTLAVHTGALILRMYLMNRPFVFVTNLYGTAIFIGWVAGLAGLTFEAINRNGIGNFVIAVAGFITMIIAQFLAIGEDTMEMMRAVLDTNFWLATHVTCVNIGYAGTLVAGKLGILFILRGFLTSSLDKAAVKKLGDAIYGAVCFAMLFSFVGTVLGGIWADQSWGRFWGWDPKENGALLVVVWNALILHARWGGMVKQRGMAVLALFGNIIVIWSWWGVNMLGVGLHAYANADPAMLTTVVIAVLIHVALMVVGLMPLSLWQSFNGRSAPAGRPRSVLAPAT